MYSIEKENGVYKIIKDSAMTYQTQVEGVIAGSKKDCQVWLKDYAAFCHTCGEYVESQHYENRVGGYDHKCLICKGIIFTGQKLGCSECWN